MHRSATDFLIIDCFANRNINAPTPPPSIMLHTFRSHQLAPKHSNSPLSLPSHTILTHCAARAQLY